MDQEKERQLTMLQEIYDNWTPPTPAFKAHHEGVPEGMVPYISSSDVHDYKYNIRIHYCPRKSVNNSLKRLSTLRF